MSRRCEQGIRPIWRFITSCVLGVALPMMNAVAQSSQPIVMAYDIPALPLEAALQQVADKAKLQLLYSPADLKGVMTRGLKGSYTIKEAINRLIDGTGLSASFNGQNAVAIKPARPSTGAELGNPTILAQAPSQSAGASEDTSDSRRASAAVKGEKIEVTGSRLPRAGDEGAQQVKIYSRDRIDRSGKTTIPEFLNTLPEVSIQSTQDRISTNAGETTVRLHGFPAGTTATLLNGRRLPVSGNAITSFDLTALPLAIIERIEVLPSGSSAIYGSDAIAGVVNFITKRELEGLHLTASLGHAEQYTNQNYSVAWGHAWTRGGFSVIGSYEKNDPLFGRDRALLADADYRRFAGQGGTDRRVDTCWPGTVLSTTSANLPGIGARTAGIPNGLTGVVPISAFSPGIENKCSVLQDFSIIPSTERSGLFATGRYELDSSIEVFAEALYSHSLNDLVQDTLSFNRVIPASNAFNPFGVSVQVQRLVPLPQGNSDVKDYFRPLVGLRGNLVDLQWEAAAWRSQERNRISALGTQIAGAIATALASPDRATAFNPFASTDLASPAVLDAMFPTTTSRFRSDVNAADARLRGEIFNLPAGPVAMVMGGEYQDQKFYRQTIVFGTTNPTTFDTGRRVGAVFSEVRVPILAGPVQGADLLDVSAAGRYDHYNDFGTAFTPQFGVELRPASDLLLRGSYAKAFRAPQLTQLYTPAATTNFVVTDTQRPGNPVSTVPGTTMGNPDLRPETGRAYSLGLLWAGDALPGLRASINYWRLQEENRIANPSLQAIIAFPDIFPGRVTRNPGTGAIQSVINTPANFGALRADGFDIAVAYAFTTQIGKFTPSVDWVLTTKYDAAITPGAPLVDRLSLASDLDAWAPRHKAVLSLDWQKGRYSARAAGRYVGSYLDYQTIANTNRIGNFALWDISGRVDLTGLVPGLRFKQAFLSASITNLFDKEPQFSNFRGGSFGYDPSQADILGRFVRVGIGLDW